MTLTADLVDAADPAPAPRIVSVTSNEPASGMFDGDLSPYWEMTGALTLNLRAERGGGGRAYTITVEGLDRSGNKIAGTVMVTVPHNQ